jgi:hypothetical protein
MIGDIASRVFSSEADKHIINVFPSQRATAAADTFALHLDYAVSGSHLNCQR